MGSGSITVCVSHINRNKSAFRTDTEYRYCTDEYFHTSTSPSILSRIPNFDISK